MDGLEAMEHRVDTVDTWHDDRDCTVGDDEIEMVLSDEVDEFVFAESPTRHDENSGEDLVGEIISDHHFLISLFFIYCL